MRRAEQSTRLVAVAILLGGLIACEGGDVPVMGGVSGRVPVVPPVVGYLGGEEIAFIHTEASDSAIAGTLTEMMGSPVPVVPELARVPGEATADVYVFTNGVEPDGARGPLGFQPDVFDCLVGEPCYSPLRAVNLVTWTDPAEAEVLTSAAEVRRAAERGLVAIARPGVVVNMPLLTWPGGER